MFNNTYGISFEKIRHFRCGVHGSDSNNQLNDVLGILSALTIVHVKYALHYFQEIYIKNIVSTVGIYPFHASTKLKKKVCLSILDYQKINSNISNIN